MRAPDSLAAKRFVPRSIKVLSVFQGPNLHADPVNKPPAQRLDWWFKGGCLAFLLPAWFVVLFICFDMFFTGISTCGILWSVDIY